MERYCQLWKPASCAEDGRIAEYSGGVIVASTSQAWTSCSMIRLTRASILNARPSSSRATRRDRRAQLVEHQLHPQLGGLVLDDEQHLVVVRRERVLRGSTASRCR